MSEAAEIDITHLVGHTFAGGTRRIEHWENYLLTDCTGIGLLPDGLVHPIVLFHMPIQGANTSITELFELGHAAGAGSVGLESYDWEYFEPLIENIDYVVEGSIVSVERLESDSGKPYDRLVFSIELHQPDGTLAARVTNTWRFRRAPR